MLKIGDIVKATLEAWDHWRKVLPSSDTLLERSRDSIYKIVDIWIDPVGQTVSEVSINPEDTLCSYGSDGLPIDRTNRNLTFHWLVDGELEKTFMFAINPVIKIIGSLYCSCSAPIIVQNQTLGNSFLYCRICKKEKI
jgi:hypothetical protein